MLGEEGGERDQRGLVLGEEAGLDYDLEYFLKRKEARGRDSSLEPCPRWRFPRMREVRVKVSKNPEECKGKWRCSNYRLDLRRRPHWSEHLWVVRC